MQTDKSLQAPVTWRYSTGCHKPLPVETWRILAARRNAAASGGFSSPGVKSSGNVKDCMAGVRKSRTDSQQPPSSTQAPSMSQRYSDLRDFIAQLEARGELKRIAQPVSPRLEM